MAKAEYDMLFEANRALARLNDAVGELLAADAALAAVEGRSRWDAALVTRWKAAWEGMQEASEADEAFRKFAPKAWWRQD